MKKIILLLALFTIVLTLGACGDNKKETEEKTKQTKPKKRVRPF